MKTKITLLSLLLAGRLLSQVDHNLVLALDFENVIDGIVDSSSAAQAVSSFGTVTDANDKWNNTNAAMSIGGISVPGEARLTNHLGSYKVQIPATISAWVKLNSFDSFKTPIFTTEDHSSKYTGLWIEINSSGAVQASYGNGVSNTVSNLKAAITTTNPITLGNWYHIVAVYNSTSSIDIYVNGIKQNVGYLGGANTCVYSMITGTPGKVGAFLKGYSPSRYLDGSLDKIRLYDTVLTYREIQALYYTSYQNKSTLLLDYHMNNGVADSSIYNQVSSQNGTCVFDSDRFGIPSSALATSISSGIQLDDVNGNFKTALPATFASWIKVNSLNLLNSIFTTEDGPMYSGLWIHLTTSGQIAVNIGDKSGTGSSARKSTMTTGTPIAANSQWKHIAVVMNPAPAPNYFSADIYIDGVLQPNNGISGAGMGLLYYNTAGNYAKLGTFNTGALEGSIDQSMFWNTALTAQQVTDLFTFQNTPPAGVAIKDFNKQGTDFKIYPNPANDRITIEFLAGNKNQFCGIYDLSGRNIIEQKISEEHTIIDISTLEKGIYILKYWNDSGSVLKKFIKE